jgi:hypothetical protein
MLVAHTKEYYELCGADPREAMKYSKYPHHIYVSSVNRAVDSYLLDCSRLLATTREDPRVVKLGSLLLQHFRLCRRHLRTRGGSVSHGLQVESMHGQQVDLI